MKNKCTRLGNCNITPCLRRRPLGFCIKESGIDLDRGRFEVLLLFFHLYRQLLTNPAIGVVDSKVIGVYSQRFSYSMSFYCNLLGCCAELKFASLVLVERRRGRRCLGTRERSGDTTRGRSATSRRGKEFSS